MRIANIVLSKQKGGLERASLDYVSAFLSLGYEVSLVLRNSCRFAEEAEQLSCAIRFQRNRFGIYDPFALWELRSWIRAEKPDAIFAHGNRAITLLRLAAKGLAPVVAVNHTVNVRRSLGAQAVIVVNAAQKSELLRLGHAKPDSVYVVPNMVTVKLHERERKIPEKPPEVPVLGVLSRFWEVKGIDIFINALAELKRRGVKFRACIGGDGVLRAKLSALSVRENLDDVLEFAGWITDREEFYRSIDIFCLPSRSETFGIVLLEAFQHKVPVIVTRTVGPLEITEGHDVAYFVPSEDSAAFADAVEILLAGWEETRQRAYAAFDLVDEKYDIHVVAKRLQTIIEQVTTK